jgi:chemotaxis protein CheD
MIASSVARQVPPSQATGPEQVLSLGEWAVTDEASAVLTCLGLGSCVALVLLDRTAGVGGMAHMVLPDSNDGRAAEGTAKFVDQAVPLLLQRMGELGALTPRISVALVGGAKMLSGAAFSGRAHIGERNTEAARAALEALGIPIVAEDLGGERGRTVRLRVGEGTVSVSEAGSAAHPLAI